MTHIHNREIEQFKDLFRQEGIDRIEERFTILEAFLATERHLTGEELADRLEGEERPPGRKFTEDTMKLLCHYGFAHAIRFDDGPVRYEHRHLGQHHDHMVCTKCRKIIEFREDAIEILQEQIARSHGFHMLQHKMEIYGICGDCRQQRVSLMPLATARQGECVVIKGFSGGRSSQSRLSSMGLREGDRVEVLTSQGKGQLVIAVAGKRYVLGHGISAKIMVLPAEEAHLLEAPASEALSPSAPEGSNVGPPIPLSRMKEGESGRIVRVGGSGALRRRILEMGLIRGSEIHVEKYAPLKDPVELIVKGYHVSLRVSEAAHITVDSIRRKR